MKVLCLGCGYRFESATTQTQCPYCGQKNKLTKLEDAETLVDEL